MEGHMSKIVQLLGRISRMRRRVITTTLLSALALVPAVVVAQSPSTHFEVLHAFHGGDGEIPVGLKVDAAGNVYGTTLVGGDLDCSDYPGTGCGAVFQLNTTGKAKVLHKFTGAPDGFLAGPTLSRDAQGNLYGVTYYGGDVSCFSLGCGIVFKVDKSGKETVLRAFTGIDNGDGQNPSGGVILDGSGKVYGTTSSGGVGYGIVFEIAKSGKETVLYSFLGSPSEDGASPYGSLVEDAAGNLYGTTMAGGNSCPQAPTAGCGVVFKLDKSGTETILHRFTGAHGDGAVPNCTLVLDKEGNFYGSTTEGGASNNGVVFKLTKTGKETILYTFSGSDGSQPVGPVVLDSAGNLYGTTFEGGKLGYGTVFKLAKGAKKIVLLHTFSGNEDGGLPDYGLSIDGAGSLYGATEIGGALKCTDPEGQGCGVVFKITQ
jgi:uncharacterized repeat protein (TIGR03803 family)